MKWRELGTLKFNTSLGGSQLWGKKNTLDEKQDPWDGGLKRGKEGASAIVTLEAEYRKRCVGGNTGVNLKRARATIWGKAL